MTLDAQLEAVLFFKAVPVAKRALCTLFAIDDAVLNEAIQTLASRLEQGATRLVDDGKEISLVTAPEFDELIEAVRKDELKRDIGRAGAETLAIIAYRGPLSRAEIDRIRGVNSAYILRNLLTRGLIERTANNQRNEYGITTALLSHLGITKRTDLPGFKDTMDALDTYEQEHQTTV